MVINRWVYRQFIARFSIFEHHKVVIQEKGRMEVRMDINAQKMNLPNVGFCFPFVGQLSMLQQFITYRTGKMGVAYTMCAVAIDEQIGVDVVALGSKMQVLCAKL